MKSVCSFENIDTVTHTHTLHTYTHSLLAKLFRREEDLKVLTVFVNNIEEESATVSLVATEAPDARYVI